MVQFATRHAAAAVWKAVLAQTQVVLVLYVHRTSQGSGHVEREEYALICTGIARRRVCQAARDAAVHRLGRCTNCDHEESSEDAKGVDNHRVEVKSTVVVMQVSRISQCARSLRVYSVGRVVGSAGVYKLTHDSPRRIERAEDARMLCDIVDPCSGKEEKPNKGDYRLCERFERTRNKFCWHTWRKDDRQTCST